MTRALARVKSLVLIKKKKHYQITYIAKKIKDMKEMISSVSL
jgi:hypothetical protein